MNNIQAFKKKIWGYSLIIGILLWLISLFFLKINTDFAIGLFMGTSIGIINFQILTALSEKVIEEGRPVLAGISSFLRLCIYGVSFLVAMKIGNMAAIGCVVGFMTQKLAIFYIYVIKDKLIRREKGA